MIKGAIFDLDGVVLDSMSAWEKAGIMFLHNLGLEAEPELAKDMYCMSMTEGAKYLKERYCVDMAEEAIIKGINDLIKDYYAHQVQLKQGVEQFLKGLQQAGIKIVAATSCDREVFTRALVRLKVIDYFDRIFTSTEIGVGKVKPDIYLAAAAHMGTVPEETWVFEDALYALRTAKSVGFNTVGVYDDYALDTMDEIKKICDIYLMKLDDVQAFLAKASA